LREFIVTPQTRFGYWSNRVYFEFAAGLEICSSDS